MKTFKDFNDLVKKIGFGPAVIIHNSKTKSKLIMEKVINQNQPLEQWLFIYKHSHERSKLCQLARHKLLHMANDLDSLSVLFDIFPDQYRFEIFKKIIELDKNKQLPDGFSHWEKILPYCYLDKKFEPEVETCLSHMCHYAKTFNDWALILLLSTKKTIFYKQLASDNIEDFKPSAKDWILFCNQCIENMYYVNLDIILSFIDSIDLSFNEWVELLPLATEDDIRVIILDKLKTLY